jgi:divalent metal cation (Fe/Co/Zn/Cd) transporter
VTGNAVYDGIGSVGVGALLIIVASGLGVEIKSLLIGESAAPRNAPCHPRVPRESSAGSRIQNLLTLQQQGDEIFIAAQLEIDPAALRPACRTSSRNAKPICRRSFRRPNGSTSSPLHPTDCRTR